MKKSIITTLTTLTTLLTSSSLAATYTDMFYNKYMNTSDSTFTYNGSIYFKGGWDSLRDTVTVTGDLNLNENKTYNITGAKITAQSLNLDRSKQVIKNSEITAQQGFLVKNGANTYIEDSTLNITKQIYMQGVSSLGGGVTVHIKNSTTTFNASELSHVKDGSTLIIEGGSFTATGANKISITQGSTIEFKNTSVDLGNSYIATNTDSSFKDTSAKIVIDNSTFNSQHMELYGYETAGALPLFEIKNGATVTTSINMRGGTISVSGEGTTLTLTSSLQQTSRNADGQMYTSNIIVEEGSKLSVDGDINLDSIEILNGSVEAENIFAKTLVVSEESSIALVDGGSLSFESLEVVVNDILANGTEIDLNNVLSGDLSVVLSAIESDTQLVLSDGVNKFDAFVNADGVAVVGVVPEPSTYAMIFGAFALAFAIYRRRK